MKNTKQMRTGNVTGAGKKYRGKPAPATASIPRNLPPPRAVRRNPFLRDR